MARITLEIDKKTRAELNVALARIGRELNDEVEALVEKYTSLIYDEARATVPVKSGRLKKAIEKKLEDLVGEVYVNRKKAPHGSIVEFGSKPHLIKPKHKRALAWEGVVTKGPVQHPGTKARPFIIPAFEKHKKPFMDELRRVLKTVLG